RQLRRRRGRPDGPASASSGAPSARRFRMAYHGTKHRAAGPRGRRKDPAMRFAHIIQINSQEFGAPPLLSREQAWRGIALRAYDPALFGTGLGGHAVRRHERHSDDSEVIDRTLHFGAFEVDDRVTLTPMQEVHVEVAGTERWPACSATTRIEEPEPGA